MTWTTQPRSEGAGGLSAWVQGAGPALVLIHGVGLRAEAWGAVMPVLSAQFTVHAVDMPGHGSSPLQGAATLVDYVARVAEYIEVLGTPVTVAGHSMGAMISLELAIRRPELVQSVCALNAVFERTPEAAQAVQSRANALATQGKTDPDPTLARWFGPNPTGALQSAATACHDWLTTVDTAGYARAYLIFAHHDGPSRPDLAAVQMPALFLTGADDPNSTPAMSRAMADLIPQGRVQIIEGAAHMALMTHPADITKAIRKVAT